MPLAPSLPVIGAPVKTLKRPAGVGRRSPTTPVGVVVNMSP